MGSQKNHSRRKKRKFHGNQSVEPQKLEVNTDGDKFLFEAEKT